MTHKPICLPLMQDSIDITLLQSFIDMRKEDTKKPMTQRALDMLIRKLSRLEAQGHCPNLLLEKSIIGTFQDVYPDAMTMKPRESFIAMHTDSSWRDTSFSAKYSDRSWADGLH